VRRRTATTRLAGRLAQSQGEPAIAAGRQLDPTPGTPASVMCVRAALSPEDTVSPRGEHVAQLNYRLERDEWRCPVPVEIAGLEPCRPLFRVRPP
jgi:hypothetical protein